MAANLLDNRLLVVIDHDPALGQVVKSAAEAAGFEVVLTENPASFVKTARTWDPTVLMLDLRVPGTDGIQLLRRLAKDKCTAHVILMSHAEGKVMESAMQIGRERGLNMSGFLHQPVTPETLRELLIPLRPVHGLLAKDLAQAIATDQLFLEYQLKFDCRLSRMTGAEALVRWQHPMFGILQPDQFIALAEESDLIHRLTDWVVMSAARQMAAWNVGKYGLEIAVNISAKNLEDPDFPDRIHQQCQDAGANCTAMTLELTETGAMREEVQMMDALTRLRLKGFMLSIDDFGTGYSSLVQLQRMPFSEVKIDRSFVVQMMENEGCMAIVEIIVDLARKLGLKSVAEGVEDEAALRCLCALGCDTIQGYHLSRPLNADLIPALISEYRLMRVKSGAPKPPRLRPLSPFTNARAWRRRKQPVMLDSGPIVGSAVQGG